MDLHLYLRILANSNHNKDWNDRHIYNMKSLI